MWPKWFPLPSTLILLLAAGMIGKSYLIQDVKISGDSTSLNVSVVAAQQQKKTSNKMQANQSSKYSPLILQRPLFAETRRPISFKMPLKKNTQPVVAAPEPSFTLAGVLISNSQKTALIGVNDNQREWFLEGSTIHGWLLLEVSSNKVLLEKKKQIQKVYLYSSGQ